MKYGFIGCGNMGSSLVRALSNSTTDIAIADFSDKAKVSPKSWKSNTRITRPL